MDCLFQVGGLPKPAVGRLVSCLPFFFGCLLVLVSSETLLSHSARSAFLTLVIKDGYRSSAVLAFP